jgi:EpsD family peptidyl-prolyl cis-trans isomerase
MLSLYPHALALRPLRVAAATALAMLAASCGSADNATTQAAARVNKDEITVHQIGAQLAQRPGLRPEQVMGAEREILENLINRQLAVQKATELKVDREPKVVQAIESARLDIIARAYADKLGEGVTRPSAADIKKYYEDHPALFSQRRVYHLQEFAIEASAPELEALKAALPALKTADSVVGHLKANNVKFGSTQAVRAAEQLPLALLPALSRLGEGQALLEPTRGGARLIVLQGVRPQPVSEERAARAIEQYLVNEQRRRLLADDLKALRAAAHIDYRGRYAASVPAAGDPVPAASPADVAASAAAELDTKASDPLPGAASQADGGADASTLTKGLGLK